jgi:predicted porin
MKKTLLAVAVAAALPAFAQAQTQVTLSGIVKTGYAYVDIGTGTGGVAGGSASIIADGSSRFIISGSEELGGGMQATFQWDTRLRADEGSGTLGSGNSWVGLKNAKSWGELRVGRLDQYYFRGTDGHAARATALQAWNVGILSYVGGTGNLSQAVANGSRTSNLIRWDAPNWNGFSGGIGWSTAFQTAEGFDTAGKGSAISADVYYSSGPITAGFSYWDANFENKSLGGQNAWRAYGAYQFGPVNVGFTWDQSEITDNATGGTGENKRSAWSIPVLWKVGPGTVIFAYTQADDRKVRGSTLNNSGAKMWSIGYDYPLSRRTSVGLSYVDLSNDANAAYQLFTGGALGNVPTVAPGADVSQIYLGLRHAF